MARYVFLQLSLVSGRQHRWLVALALVLGLVGLPGYVTASPVLVPNHDQGGSGSATSTPTNEATALRLFDAVMSQRTPDVCPLLMAAAAMAHTPDGDFAGPSGFEQYVAIAWSAFPDATFAADEQSAVGDVVMLRWTMTGRHLDAFGDQPATGATVRLEGLAMLRFENGMITETWLQYDRASLAEQIAAIEEGPRACPPCEEP